MKQQPIFENVYTRIDILDIVDNAFARVASIYLLGEDSKYAKTPADINVKNKPLASSIGVNTIKVLELSQQPVTGGDDWDELDELDFEELLNAETMPIIDDSSKKIKSIDIKGDQVSNMILYSKDKISDVAEKIALITKIKPYKQYLWMPEIHQSLTGDDTSLMSYWATAVRQIEGYPIDGQYGNSNVHQSSIETFTRESALVINCISLDSIVGNKSKLQMIARSDSESFELIYANLIQRFYPLLSMSMFVQYLSDESQLEIKYEDLAFDAKDAMKRHNQFDKLLPELNKQKQITIDSTEMINITTTGMIISNRYYDHMQRIDTMRLFQNLDVTTLANVAMVDLYRFDNERRSVRIRKLPQRDQYRIAKDDILLFSGFYTRRSLVQLRTMVITLLPKKEYELVMIIIDQYGTIWIKMQPSQTYGFSKATFLALITPVIDPIIKILNSYETAFITQERLPLLKTSQFLYETVSSSSKITFRFPVSYQHLLDLFANKFLSAGIIAPFSTDWNRARRSTIYFEIRYGVSRIVDSTHKHKVIEIKNVGGVAILALSNLDVEETSLYIDFIGRLVTGHKSELALTGTGQQSLTVVDPILYRPRVSSDMYSRICQKRFQPVITTSDDPKAVEYYNFTFDKPEYYKCPSKDAPILGFIQNKHDKGYCLPCCRKTKPATDIKDQCINQTNEVDQISSTYKIDYPIHEVPNQKIMNRRVALPAYVMQLLGLTGLVANGSILTTHATIQDGMDPSTKSFLQTAMMIAAIPSMSGKPLYTSYRELIIDMITFIKQPLSQMRVMRNPIISERYVTPQALIHAIEDQFLKMTILDIHERLSAVEWNDMIIFIANCMGLNVLLLFDDRMPNSNINMVNLNDIDVQKPVVIFIKRMNLEWSNANHNTRALYLPITSSAFKVQYKVALILERLDTTKTLPKVKRITSGKITQIMNKQLTLDRLQPVIASSKQYKLSNDLSDQKVAIVNIGKSKLITTISTIITTVSPQPIDIATTASINDMLAFITSYNEYYLDETPDSKTVIGAYKTYLQAAIKMTKPYEYISIDAFLLKVIKFIIVNDMTIGAVIALYDVNKVIATELMFFKPISTKAINSEINKIHKGREALESRLNARAIITFPAALQINLVTWTTNPLTTMSSNKCKQDMLSSFNEGAYINEIYHILSRDIIDIWQRERLPAFDTYMSKELKKIGAPPILQTTIDAFIVKTIETFDLYDPLIIRSTLGNFFEKLNTTDKTNAAIISRFKEDPSFTGFEIRNLHRLSRTNIKNKIQELLKDVIVKTNAYPSFDLDITITEQHDKFYKNGKLLIYNPLYADLVDMLVSDLTNPFRRDYIINAQLAESLLSDLRLHTGELIYIQHLSDK